METLSGQITLFFMLHSKDSTQYCPPKNTECLANTDFIQAISLKPRALLGRIHIKINRAAAFNMVHIYSKESTPQNESSVVVYSRKFFFEKTQTFPEAGCPKLFEFSQFLFIYIVCKSCEVIVDTQWWAKYTDQVLE